MNNEEITAVVRIVIILMVCVGIFTALRAFFLWYWKMDKVVELLETQNAILKALLKKGENEKV